MAANLSIERESMINSHGQFLHHALRIRIQVCRGSTALEIIVALFLLSTLAVISGQIVVSVVQTRIEQRKRAYALQEAGNVMEQAFLLAWSELEVGQTKEWPCSQSAKQVLRNPRVFLLTKAVDHQGICRIVVTVEWSHGREQVPQRVQLVAFRHRSGAFKGSARVTDGPRNSPGVPRNGMRPEKGS